MTGSTWASDGPGVMPLPSGRLVRGRGLRKPLPSGPVPEFGLYLLGSEPEPVGWDSRWIRWRDFWLPSDPGALRAALGELLGRAQDERVEIACAGGVGRTGTALSCLVVLDGLAADRAVAYVRENYSPRAVETPWQHRFVKSFTPAAPDT